ncbi:unnamed protein product [Haemonchus placei]|uniref:Uncharacterized protein n=1 Tax=Haemonchus placei TaxID=6290 RepID=A0A0N4VU31_HAEPC|nr:unnamed protein product [Haemonchus placei]
MIRSLSNTSLSVVVDRFFSRAPFDALSPHRLMLLADFMTKDEVKCKSLPTIKAMKWARHHCALRIHLAMPGIDNPSDDQYYYDDLSPIETEFSAEIFEGAELVRFWVEISTIRSLERILSSYSLTMLAIFGQNSSLGRDSNYAICAPCSIPCITETPLAVALMAYMP